MLHDLYRPLIQLKNYNCTLANTPEHFSKVGAKARHRI